MEGSTFDHLLRKRCILWDKYNDEQICRIMEFSDDYKRFISKVKTERETVEEIVYKAKQEGFVSLKEAVESGRELKPGDKIYGVNRDKGAVLFIIGYKPLTEGMNIIASHVDCPRLDIKPNPLYEAHNLAMLDTHYYGSIKKYQWTAVPLSIHGVIIRKNGEKINAVIGEDANDPVFYISDLLIHLAGEQMQKKLSNGIEGEDLDILFGSIPYCNKEVSERVKLNVLKLLNEKYCITEEDFWSAELDAVPAGPARDVGIDRSMVMAYGHDDRLCAYASLNAILNIKNPEKTCAALFVDKEETGNYGASSVQSRFFEEMISELVELSGGYSSIKLMRLFRNSKIISADAICAFDPNYGDAFDVKNTAYMGQGVVILRYSGVKGKIETNDADAEFIGFLRRIFDECSISCQAAEFGGVDKGGSETISHILGHYGAEVLDVGVPILGMHSPYEIASKADIFEFYRACETFYNKSI